MTEIERVQYKLMLPAQLKSALEESAHDNRRSLSAEIITRLYGSFDAEERSAERSLPSSNSETLIDVDGLTDEQAKNFVVAFLKTYDRLRNKKP